MATLENAIDESIKVFHGRYPYEYASSPEIIPEDIRIKIAEKYKSAGWKHVYYNFDSNRASRFIFSMIAPDPKYIKYYTQI